MTIMRTLQTIVSIAIIPLLLLARAIRFAVFAIIDGCGRKREKSTTPG